MIRLYFLGDGFRDKQSLYPLVKRIIGAEVDGPFVPLTNAEWPRLNGPNRSSLNSSNKGYDNKLKFAIAQAKDSDCEGMVIVVDQDKETSGSRLAKLQNGREEVRQKPPPYFPIALGEAAPHGEAWLLDDPVAVRSALDLTDDCNIPSLKHERSPKLALNKLISESKHRRSPYVEMLKTIACNVDPKRCQNRKETGFQAFVDDLEAEIKPLATTPMTRDQL